MLADDILYTATTDKQPECAVEVTRAMLEHADLIRVSSDMLHLIDGVKGLSIHVESADFVRKEYLLRVDGKQLTVWLRDTVESRVHDMGFDRNGQQVRLKLVHAPMPGMVLKVLVQDGEDVTEGQAVIVLEAMKMENVLVAPATGTVSVVHIREGQNVDKNQLLVELD